MYKRQGIPNISTDIASIPEVIENGKNGFLIQPGDKALLEEKMISLLNDPLQREEFSKNGFSVKMCIRDRFSPIPFPVRPASPGMSSLRGVLPFARISFWA